MNIRIIIILFFTILIAAACSSTRKAVDNGSTSSTEHEVVILTEDKRIEFEFYFIEGLKQNMLGNTDVAIQYFNGCLEINPHSAASLYELAKIYATKGDVVSARLLLERAIDINPDNSWYKLLLARIYQGTNQIAKASNIYNELIKNDPENVEYYYVNAMLLTNSGDYKAALNAYDQLENLMGYNEQIAIARQHIHRESGNNKAAYKEIEQLIETYPDVPEYYGIMADMYSEDGNVEKALEYYNRVLEIDPYNGFVHFSLATFHFKNSNFDKGYEHAKIGFSHHDVEIETKIQLYLMLSNAPADLKIEDEKILTLIECIIETHPDDTRSYGILADFMISRGKLNEAREYIGKALNINPNSYELWEQLIILDNQMNDYVQMDKTSSEAISLFPTQPFLYMLNAVANIQMKEYEKAINMLETGELYLVDNKRLEAQFALNKAEAYYSLSNSEKAFAEFERVIETDPENYIALNNYAYYLATRGEMLEKAEQMSSKVIKANPNNATYLDTHAWVLFKKGEYRLARFYMDTALQNGGLENAVILEHYGDILFKLEKIDEAIEYWKKALELGSDSDTLQKKIEKEKYIEEGINE